jgi:hypothetical protein
VLLLLRVYTALLQLQADNGTSEDDDDDEEEAELEAARARPGSAKWLGSSAEHSSADRGIEVVHATRSGRAPTADSSTRLNGISKADSGVSLSSPPTRGRAKRCVTRQ